MKQFRLYIDLANDAMQDGDDVAAALHKLADGISAGGLPVGQIILDDNGNAVGRAYLDK